MAWGFCLNLWKCPKCGRGFARRSQWHSCLSTSVDQHFRGVDPVLREMYDLLIGRSPGVDAVKSSVNLASRYHFGLFPADVIMFASVSYRTKSLRARIVRIEKVGPN